MYSDDRLAFKAAQVAAKNKEREADLLAMRGGAGAMGVMEALGAMMDNKRSNMKNVVVEYKDDYLQLTFEEFKRQRQMEFNPTPTPNMNTINNTNTTSVAAVYKLRGSMEMDRDNNDKNVLF